MINISKGGVLFTFDDGCHIDYWYKVIDVFDEFNAKGTFFINAPDELTDEQWRKLAEIQNRARAIGAHGHRHQKAVDYCNNHSEQEWLDNEVLPCLNKLQEKGFDVKSFAYPCSQSNEITNNALKPYFSHAHTGVPLPEGKRFCELNEIFTPVNELADQFLLNGKSIDCFDDAAQIDETFKRASTNSEVVVFYSHNVASAEEKVNPVYLTQVRNLRKFMTIAIENEIEFYTYNDLP